MSHRHHEWPLAVFTALATVGGGLVCSPLAAIVAGGSPSSAAPLMVRGAVLVAAGMLVSIAHIGRPHRAPRAIAGIGRSWLSAEILLGGVTVAAPAMAALTNHSSGASALVTAAVAAAFLISIGFVYNLPGQYSWRGLAVLAPASLGFTFGAIAYAALALAASTPAPGTGTSATNLVLTLIGVDAVLFLVRARRLACLPSWCRPANPAVFARRTHLLVSRLILANALPALLVLLGRPWPAAAALALGILVERAAFYALAAQHTTEGEVARVEEGIRPGPIVED